MAPESEIIRFIQLWLIVYLFLAYSFLIGKLVSPGKIRFLLILPVVILFVLLPLRITSVTLCSFTSFLVSWITPFNLILFSFNKGPLPSINSIIPFVAAALLPIKISPKSKLESNPLAQNETVSSWRSPEAKRYAVKVAVISLVFKLYSFKTRLPTTAVMLLHTLHVYISLDLFLALIGAAARAVLDVELEPQFNEPYLATSLRDFWGKRWNLVVSGILRPSIYQPITSLLTGPLNKQQAQSIATLTTFGVSGIMHQLIIYHMNRLYPTGQMTSFFMLNGICVVAEAAVARRLNGKWRLPKVIASCLTVLFVISTAFWLFFPEVLVEDIDARCIHDYTAFLAFVRSVTDGTIFTSFNGLVSLKYFFKQILLF